MRRAKKRTGGLKRLLVVMLAAALLFPLSNYMAPEARAAVTKAEINELKSDAEALEKEKKELQQQLKQIEANKDKAMDQKALLERQINVLQDEINNMAQQIVKYDELILIKEQELASAQQDEADQYRLFCERVRAMEEDGEVNYWAILFNAASFSDLLDRVIMVDEIMEYDNAVMDNLIAIREQIEVDKAELEQARTDQKAAKVAQEAAKKELEARESDVEKLIAQIKKQESAAEHAIDELTAKAEAMDKEIAQKEKELAAQLAAQGNKITSEKGYLWPLKNYSNLSSLYAGRIDPFTGKPATHSGIDVPAPKGVQILAAKSGVVITAAYQSGGYGNYVVISHGDGNTTLYAHMSSRKVKVGDVVKQGQVIGLVGSTGRSTGNHLHYEIRENGVRIDPTIRYSGLTYGSEKLPQNKW